MSDEPWGSTRVTYTKDNLDMVGDCFAANLFVISKAFVCVKSLWPECPPEVIVELLDELDSMQRGEPSIYPLWRDRFNGNWSSGTDRIEILSP